MRWAVAARAQGEGGRGRGWAQGEAGRRARLGVEVRCGLRGTRAGHTRQAGRGRTQSKSRKRRVTENWPNLYCGSEVFVVTSYVKCDEMPCPSMHGLVTVTSKLGEEAPPALA